MIVFSFLSSNRRDKFRQKSKSTEEGWSVVITTYKPELITNNEIRLLGYVKVKALESKDLEKLISKNEAGSV